MIKRFVCMIVLCLAVQGHAEPTVTTVDLIAGTGVGVNAAGPLLVQMDNERNRLIVANTLTSSLTLIDGTSHAVRNIPIGGRALQHLKTEAMTVRRKTGDIYLIGDGAVHIIFPDRNTSRTIATEFQFESIAVDEETGNAFIAGRESKHLGFYDAKRKKLHMRKWLDTREDLINLNATPPPPIRKVVTDRNLNRVIAVDGTAPALHLFDAKDGTTVTSRPLDLDAGGRWHLAGYNDKTHHLYIVVETDRRKVIQAARIDIVGGDDTIVPLPEYTEGVGIIYNPAREEVYIPYDNHPSVHVVTFAAGGSVDEIKIPAYGNDASAIDTEHDLLYIASWAFGEIDIVDCASRTLVRRIPGLGIIPHMFTMAFNPNANRLYFPKGATAVNGTFGSAITVFDPESGRTDKIHTGWAPIELIELPDRNSFLVFGSEDRFAEVHPDGRYAVYRLPFDYPVNACRSPGGNIYLSYGPHQSYWPTVYIWDAKNGVLTIDKEDLSFYDRRIPRQAHKMVLDRNGVLYFTQNNWGGEQQFLGILEDEVRVFEAGKRIALPDTVEREITQRILRYDRKRHRLYLVRVGERDEDPSILQVIDPEEQSVIGRIPLGRTATDLCCNDSQLFIANFDSKSISVIDKTDFTLSEIEMEGKPLKLCRCGSRMYVIDHTGNKLRNLSAIDATYTIPHEGLPDNIFNWNGTPVITSHSSERCYIIRFDPATERFTLIHEHRYPYGDTSFDTRNISFYVRGQFGDAIFEITKGRVDTEGRLWIVDYLSGKLFIVTGS
ncbi:MAG: hypothetical protein JSV33_14760 [bacterium]|nr:MAG: hypothetical protein JSV33_14760 [bacterium]